MANDPAMEHPRWLTPGDFAEAADPLELFGSWMREAVAKEPRDPDAATLATVDADGLPNARMVLVKGWDERGFVFYTNSESAKGRELATHPKAALVLYWKALSRQVRIRGMIERATEAESDAYFATRPRGAQIGAWASKQSRPLESRAKLKSEVAQFETKFAEQPVPRPKEWIGYRLVPLQIEFWAEQPFRLHDRVVFRRSKPGAEWTKERLYP